MASAAVSARASSGPAPQSAGPAASGGVAERSKAPVLRTGAVKATGGGLALVLPPAGGGGKRPPVLAWAARRRAPAKAVLAPPSLRSARQGGLRGRQRPAGVAWSRQAGELRRGARFALRIVGVALGRCW